MSCERCWHDARWQYNLGKYSSISEAYHALLEERKDNPCPSTFDTNSPDWDGEYR